MWFSFYSHTRQGRIKKKKLGGANYNSCVKKKFQLLLLYIYKGGAFPCPAPASPPSATDTRDLFLIANKKKKSYFVRARSTSTAQKYFLF
jgi:hypothetical protein